MLEEFTISTKVGYFPLDGSKCHAEHSLDPLRLWEAVERSADELCRVPDLVFLHNPEVTLAQLGFDSGRDRLLAGCAVLDEAVASGMCGAWGIATWDPRPVLAAIEHSVPGIQPGALLVRAGLSVGAPILTAAESLSQLLEIPPQRRWGMSPFGGTTADPAWNRVDLNAFLAAEEEVSTAQAAFRLAYELPDVARVAVGTSSSTHLRDLCAAVELGVDPEATRRYRDLIGLAA